MKKSVQEETVSIDPHMKKKAARLSLFLFRRLGRKALEEGRYGKAEALFRQAHKVQREHLDPNHPNMSCLCKNLAGTLLLQAGHELKKPENDRAFDALERLEESKRFFLDAVRNQDINAQVIGPIERIKTLYLLGTVCCLLGQMEESSGHKHKAASILGTLVEQDDPEHPVLIGALEFWDHKIKEINGKRPCAGERPSRTGTARRQEHPAP